MCVCVYSCTTYNILYKDMNFDRYHIHEVGLVSSGEERLLFLQKKYVGNI